MSKTTKIILSIVSIAALISIIVNIYAFRTLKYTREKGNYGLYTVYTEASHKIDEGLSIMNNKIVQAEDEDKSNINYIKPLLHNTYNEINTAQELLKGCQYLNKDFKLSLSNFEEYMRILSVQNDFRQDYDMDSLEEIASIYENIRKNNLLPLVVPEGYSLGLIEELYPQKGLIDSLAKIEEISKAALEYNGIK